MDAKEIAEVTGGELHGENLPVSGFHFDSREIKPGELFIPVSGKRDGHQFIGDALSGGAAGFLTSREVKPPFGKFAVKVTDTFEAFKKIALYRRRSFRGTVVAVTGSVGKTTTKELLSFLFSLCASTYSNVKSYNNLLGLTYTMANLKQAEFYFQELGTNACGEIGELSSLLSPDVGVVTAVERAHLQGFGSFEELIAEKFSLTACTEVSVVPSHLSRFSLSKETVTFGRDGDVHLTGLEETPEGNRFEVSVFGEKISLFTPVPGFSVVNASLVGGALLKVMGYPLNLLKEVSRFRPPKMRMEIHRLPGGVLIDDSYNANPASFRNALKVLSLFKMPKLVVAGEMLELGSASAEEHRLLGEEMNRLSVEELIAYGKETEETVKTFKGKAYHFTDREKLLNFLSEYPVKGKAILIKGSRGNRLEEAVKLVYKRLER